MDEVLDFLGDPKGEFVGVVPVGPAATSSRGPQKQPLVTKARCLD